MRLFLCLLLLLAVVYFSVEGKNPAARPGARGKGKSKMEKKAALAAVPRTKSQKTTLFGFVKNSAVVNNAFRETKTLLPPRKINDGSNYSYNDKKNHSAENILFPISLYQGASLIKNVLVLRFYRFNIRALSHG